MNKLDELKVSGEAPDWMNEEGFKTLSSGYLLENETPRQMYTRVARAAASYYKDSEEYEKKFFHILWKNWLCPASPVLSRWGPIVAYQFPATPFMLAIASTLSL